MLGLQISGQMGTGFLVRPLKSVFCPFQIILMDYVHAADGRLFK